ncbi:hypothetical protein Dac01nite_08280 [Demequina activiva]|uniref:Uncharacterized protein n=2 Tax=Demequina activiva TaxID=1582364 RepID=A0A919Q1A9_9MICO|nr:hypothetical protein Dac01nite_08280 [Demequina activiva]
MTPGVLVFFAVPALGAAVALVYGIVWLSSRATRASLAARYPLPLLTWIIALPMTLYAGAAVLMGVAFQPTFDSGASSGSALRSLEQLVLPVLGLATVVLGVLVIVMGHLRSRRGPWPRFAMLSVAAVPIAGVLYGTAAFIMVGDAVSGFVGMVLAVGSIANALLARPTQEARQARRDARRTAASAAVTTELPSPPPPSTPPL